MQVVSLIESAPGRYWQWRDQAIYYVQAGDRRLDRPPLLLIHGFGASTDHWRKNIAVLQQDFEVWAIDLLGFGRSAKPAWEYTSMLWREQIHAFITDVIGQPVVIAGNSLGGYAALSTAALCPSAVVGVVLLNTAGSFTELGDQPVPKPSPVREFLNQCAQVFLRQDWATFLVFKYVQQKALIRRTLQQVYLDQSAVTDQLVEDIYRPSLDPGAPKVFASVFRSPQGEQLDQLLAKLQCPLLLLWGEADPWMNARDRSPKFHQHYPKLTEYFLRAGHCPHDEVPDQVNSLMRAWVMELAA
jgi:pimeloyl-ACP methyl ester carboxylesterase